MKRVKQKSLRQLAKELGVSHSYLSQVRHGKRPPSAKVVSKVVSKMVSNVKQDGVALDMAECYNPDRLPSCVVVARGTLDP